MRRRDYLDFVAMDDKLGGPASAEAMRPFDQLYPQPNGESPLQQLVVQLANPLPYDLDETRLGEYKKLVPQWQDWSVVKQACARCAILLFDRLAAKGPIAVRRAATKLRLRLTGRWNLELRKGRRNLADFARSGSKMVHVNRRACHQPSLSSVCLAFARSKT